MATYKSDRRRCKSLGKRLEQRIKRFGITKIDLAREFSKEIGLDKSAAELQIRNYSKGYIVSRISPYTDQLTNTQLHLDRLSILYNMLGLSNRNYIVKLTKKVNPNFIYCQE